MTRTNEVLAYIVLAAVGILGPVFLENYIQQIAVLWIMVLMASTWDITGGQMGYNSLGNITFFGAGMYISAVVQISMGYDVAEYTAAFGAIKVDFTDTQYFTGIALGIIAGGIGAFLIAILFGIAVFGLRGPYFAIGTLGIAVAAGQFVGTIQYLGGGSGISMPVYPGGVDQRNVFFYILCFIITVISHIFLKWLYSTQFILAINAIRDDEDKAEAMGIKTGIYKVVAWSIAAFFMGLIGAVFGNMIGFIEPIEVAFPTATFGIFMVAMALLGGKGTLWGPILGAIVFHIIKETTWTLLLGWQWVALGTLIIINIVFFQQGIVGWLQEVKPEWFGLTVDSTSKKSEA